MQAPSGNGVAAVNANTTCTVTYEPDGEQCVCEPDQTLLDCARRLGVRISNSCGGRGACKSCAVRIVDGPATEPTAGDRTFFSEDELADGWRRACQVIPQEDCRVEIPPRSRAPSSRTQVNTTDISVHPDPAVRAYRVAVAPPSQDGRGDGDRLLSALNEKWRGTASRIDIDVLRTLSQRLRSLNWSVQAVIRYGEVVGVLPGKGSLLGIAVDLGSTNISVLLINLRTGRTIASTGMENPQSIYGADLVTRISYAKRSTERLHELRRLAVDAINRAALKLCADHSVEINTIADVVIAGNTVMQHFLLSLPVEHIGMVPFTPGINDAMNIKARDIGIQAMPGACVHVMANIAGYVGGDHTAVLLALGCETEKRTVVAMDIGTNTEISLIHQTQIFSVSCPSGPALEGGQISCGMRAADGAVEAIEVDGEQITLSVIGECDPVGLCGSGVIDVVAKLYRAGIVDKSGRISDDHPNSRRVDSAKQVILSGNTQNIGHEIVFTQHDVRAVQLAKAAIRTGMDLLLDASDISESEVDEIVIAGAFGNYIDLESCIAIGMLPKLPMERYSQIGNAAAIGAKLALSSHEYCATARSLARKATYIELAGSPEFTHRFIGRINFPEYSATEIGSTQAVSAGETHES
jgi:uncharacterized 2Fe-2S/4Fe-4S cluster protein (DUF4445 family)